MKFISDKIGDTTVYIQTTETSFVDGAELAPKLRETGVSNTLRAAAYNEIKTIIRTMAEDIGKDLGKLKKPFAPSQTQVEFHIGVSTEGGIPTIISGGGEYIVKVTMNWRSGDGRSDN
jgi:hypothetical protein